MGLAKSQVGVALARARQEAGLSMRETCRRAGITHSVLWKAEHGIGIRYSSLLKILAALGVGGAALREFQQLYSIDTFGVGAGVLEGRKSMDRTWRNYLEGISPTLQSLPAGLRRDLPTILADERMVRLIGLAWDLREEKRPRASRTRGA
jgi:transcriptional regulator with XRE-family HTH domain